MSESLDTYQIALEQVLAGKLESHEGHYKIPTTLFVPKVDIQMPPLPPVAFYELDASGEFKILRERERPFSALALSSRDFIYVPASDLQVLREHAQSQIASSTAVPVEERMKTLRKAALAVTEDLFKDPSQENIAKSSKVVGSFVYVIMKDPKAYLLLAKLSSHDPYTLQHSVGAAVNSVILGRKIGIRDEKELVELGMAGLLHDIGKVKVDKNIINKQGPLDEEEWEEMRQHALMGYEIVKDKPDVGDRAKRAILEHHEDKNGTGYPHHRKLLDLDIFSRIVAVGDIYNALTTDRSYSKARTPFEAFQLMKEKLVHKIDDELFRNLVKIYGGDV